MKLEFRFKNREFKNQVAKFHSFEKISELYRYEITLISKDEIDDVLMEEAEFIIEFGEYKDKINGIISEVEEIEKVRDVFVYKFSLVPKMYKLSLNKDSEVFLDKSLIEVFEILLKQHGLSGVDYEFRLINEYEKKEYITQYLESDFDFIKRWCERLGIYFYFEQGDREKIVFIDSKFSQKDFDFNNEIFYSQISGVEGKNIYKSAQEIKIKRKQPVRNVVVKDYNPSKPEYDLKVEVQINEAGRDIYIYEEYFQTKDEGVKLAKIIGESFDMDSERIFVKSTIPNIHAGYNYLLKDFYKEKYNNRVFFVTEVKSYGSGDTFLSEKINILQNEFVMVDADKQFRSKFLTKRPKISGVLIGKIDGETENVPFIDEEGRYKVIMPFITHSKPSGKASCWIRFLQPTGGGNKGFHFPLKKGSVVAISFVHGNPDRPVILGALPNPLNPNVVSLKNATQNVLQTQTNMKMVFDDGESFMKFISSDGSSFIKIK